MLATRLLTIGTVTTLAIGLAAAPAVAAPTDDTVVTFEIEAGVLNITVPPTIDLATLPAPGTPGGGQIGPVTASDGRAAADGSWIVSATTTTFVTGGGTATETVTAAQISYWSGTASATTGSGTFTPGQANAGAAADLADALPVFTHTGGTGNSTATWNPTLIVNTPLANQIGVYTGTVTHSMA